MECKFYKKDRDGGCNEKRCKHNMFWDKLKLNMKPHSTENSLEFSNCMCLLNREFTLEEIGEMWGLSRERVRQTERDAIIKVLSLGLNKKFNMELDFDRKIITKKLSFLRSKKYKEKGLVRKKEERKYWLTGKPENETSISN